MADTRQLVLVAQNFSAAKAKSCGLVQEVFEDDAALQVQRQETIGIK